MYIHYGKWVWSLPDLSLPNPKYCVPDFAGLLWLHVVITCPPPPHVHSEMPTSVNSTHPDMTGYQVMTVEKHISHSLLTSYWVMSDDIHMINNGENVMNERSQTKEKQWL